MADYFYAYERTPMPFFSKAVMDELEIRRGTPGCDLESGISFLVSFTSNDPGLGDDERPLKIRNGQWVGFEDETGARLTLEEITKRAMTQEGATPDDAHWIRAAYHAYYGSFSGTDVWPVRPVLLRADNDDDGLTP